MDRRTFLRASAATAAGLAIGLPSAAGAAPAGRWERLRSRLTGRLVLPTDAGYDLARQLQIAEYDAVTPEGIAYCETVADVRECVRFADASGTELRVRSGGHNYAGWSTGEGMVVDLSRLDRVQPTGPTVHLGPGSKAIDAATAAGAADRQVVEGTCPTVCAGGFLSGGGVGYQTRKFGLGCDQLVSATVVLADGSVVRCSERRQPDLFWALRGGGGGNFGIVVDFEVRPIVQPTAVQFTVTWPVECAPALFAAWQHLHRDGPRDLGSSLVLVLPDAAPGATPLLLLTGMYLGPEAGLDGVVAELSAAAGVPPASRSARELPYDEALQAAYNCDQLTVRQCHRVGQNPDAVLPRTGLQRESYRFVDEPMSTSDIGRLLDAWDAGRYAGQHRVLHTIGLGGALAERAPGDTAFVHRSALFVAGFVVQYDDPTAEDVAAADRWLDAGTAVLDPLSSGAYVNFVSSRLPGWRDRYYGANYRRLARVKSHYDPAELFRHPRSIGRRPAGQAGSEPARARLRAS